MLKFELSHAMRALPVHHHAKILQGVRFSAIALLISFFGLFSSLPTLWAQAAIVEEYYIPLPEADLLASFDAINTVAASPVDTTITIAIGGETILYYDQWENGYEPVIDVPTDLFSNGGIGCPPFNADGTQIWGNNNVCDGIPPEFVSDLLDNGDVVFLNNRVDIPRVASQIRFDGKDKVASTYPVAVTRTAYPSTPGTVLAGGTEVLKSNDWGTEYRAPLGQNVASVTNAWEYTRLYVMASSPGTQVFKNGVLQGTLPQGGNLVITVNVNDQITANKPVQVEQITGDVGSTYEMRWDSIAPTSDYSSEAYLPVGQNSGNTTRKVVAWLYNPNQVSAITVQWQMGAATGSINVPARQVVASPHIGGPDGRDGARFYTQNGAPFYAIAQIDAIGDGMLYDWGFPLIPASQLSPQVLVGNGLGCTEPGAVLNGLTCAFGNVANARSFVWVMPTSGTNVPIYVAYDGRPPVCPATAANFDATFTLSALRIRTVQQPSDLDMTGARIWTCAPGVQLAIAWGQDPERSFSGDDQGLDLGTDVFPLPSIQLEKSSSFSDDNDGDNAISPGDGIHYNLAVVNNGAFATTIVISDTLPAGVTYNAGTTQYHKANGTVVPVPDNTGPRTPFPLDEGGLSSLGGNPIVVQPGQAEYVSYEITINPNTDCTSTLVNDAVVVGTVSGSNGVVNGGSSEVTTLTCNPGIRVIKSTNGENANFPTGPLITTGDPVEWTYLVSNIGDADLKNVTLTDDKLGAITAGCVPAIPAVFVKGTSFTCTRTGTAAEGQYKNIATVNATAVFSDAVTVNDTDPSHYFGQSASIDIEKSTNGVDADNTLGPQIITGDPVTWTYRVVNTGNVPLTNINVTDNIEGPITCPQTALAPAASMICTKTGIAGEGAYSNSAIVVGTPPMGLTVTDSDPSNYFGANPGLEIKKYTNGVDADLPPGPTIAVGDVVVWTYVVTNTGNVPLEIIVTDDQGEPVNCTVSLVRQGGPQTCFAYGTALPGQYANVGTATAIYNGRVITDSDPSHYFGEVPDVVDPSISLVKFTNGVDANLPPGPLITVGQPVTWEYAIANISEVTVTSVVLTDSVRGTIICPETELGPFASMICTSTDIAEEDQYSNTARVTALPDGGSLISDTDPSNYFGVLPSMAIKKYTNGEDADNPTGPLLTEGDPVTWTYVVTNTGNIELLNIMVTDSEGVDVHCPFQNLNVGESMTCVGDIGTVQVGQYSNLGVVAGTPPVGPSVTASDPSHYIGEPAFSGEIGIEIKKYTNGEDADEPPGPIVSVGSVVNWSYVVTNTRSVPLTKVTVTDDHNVAVTCPSMTLAPGATMTCTAQGIATGGQYSNTGTVEGTPPSGPIDTASDPSHYLGAQPALSLKKYTNEEDADTPPGPYILEGGDVRWIYVLTNIGNVPLTSFSVTDSRESTIACPRIGLIAPGESLLCFTNGVAQVGQYANDSSATATPIIVGGELTDDDPSHYFGVRTGVDLEKFTNGEDADTPPGPNITVDTPVLWTYIVTNTSNVTITQIVVKDDMLGIVACPKSVLFPGEIMECTMDGIAVSGQYSNTADIYAIPHVGTEVVDSDPSHYFGTPPTALPDGEQPTQSRDIFLPFVNSNDDEE